MDITKISKEERKQLLRDWMTSQTQLIKAKDRSYTSEAIAVYWQRVGVKMTKEWVDKALYGHKSKIPKKEI